MIISRRKYEQDLKEAYENGCRETEERCWQNEREHRIFDRLDALETAVRKMQAPTEGSCSNEKTIESIPSAN